MEVSALCIYRMTIEKILCVFYDLSLYGVKCKMLIKYG